MRSRVIPPYRVAPLSINNRAYVIADRKILLEQCPVRAHALHRQNRSLNLRHGRISVTRSEPPCVADLSAGVAVEAGLIEHHVNQIPRLRSRHSDAVFDDGQNLSARRRKLSVAQKRSLWHFAISRASRL